MRPWFILTLILIASVSCTNDPDEVIAVSEDLKPSVEKGRDVTMIYSEDGQVVMKLHADKVTRYGESDPYIEFNDGLEVQFFDEYGNPGSHLTAEYGIRYEKTELTEIRRNVQVVNVRRERLTTEELIWNPQEKTIKSDKRVQIRTEDEDIEGIGFEADEEFTRWRILKPIGEVNVREDDQVSEDN